MEIFKVTNSFLILIIGLIIIAFTVSPLRNRIKDTVGGILLKRLHYKMHLHEELSKILTPFQDREVLVRCFRDFLLKTFGAKDIHILLEDKEGYTTLPRRSIFCPSPFLLRWFGENRVLQRDRLEALSSFKDYEKLALLFKELRLSLFIPLIGRGKIVGFIGVEEKTSKEAYTREEISLLTMLCTNAAVRFENIDLYRKMKDQILGVAKALAIAAEVKEGHNYGHGEKVSRYAAKIAKRMGFSSSRVEDIRTGAFLHDIGKISIKDEILKKPMKLNGQEWEEIREHPKRGYEIISSIQLEKDVVDAVRYHHERFDGRGYPYRLKGKEIPISGRITAVANAYVSMITDRPYRRSLSKKEALGYIKKGAGEIFDPEVVKVLEEIEKNEG